MQYYSGSNPTQLVSYGIYVYIRQVNSHKSSFGLWHLMDHTWQHLDRFLGFLQINLGFSGKKQVGLTC